VLFNSYAFLLAFLPLSLGGFHVAVRAGGRRLAGAWLVGASLVFYGWLTPSAVVILLASIAGNYLAARLIMWWEDHSRIQTALLVCAITTDLGVLVYYKYLATLLGLLRADGLIHVSSADRALPLGISFFTFTQIGFLIDCRQGAAREKGLLNYVLFVTFFPHVIAGPILHHREIMPQFSDPATYRASAENLAAGLGLFLIGLLKKCLLADPLASLASPGFARPQELAAMGAWQAALAYSLQLYFDFSGYSDMAIGIALMFNLRFPLNFNSPYKAPSVIEYWRRWHMTLTRYLTLYLYNPLALAIARRRAARGIAPGGRVSVAGFAEAVLLPTFVTMTFAGIWHGSGATFLVFGLLHAAFLSVNHAWRIFRPTTWKPGSGRAKIAGRVLLTYFCVLAAAIVFRAPSLSAALGMFAGMAGLHGLVPQGVTSGTLGDHRAWALVAAAFAIVWAFPNSQQIMGLQAAASKAATPRAAPALHWRFSTAWAMACGLAGALGLLSLGGTSEFLYFQF
jgi:alginate O-acetyltransferase complex protein AlgI